MRSCFLLYSVSDVLEFLSFPKREQCKLFSVLMDTQKVFIVRFEDKSVGEEFFKFKKTPDQTMLGCIEVTINLKEESLTSLTEYINADEEERLLFTRHQFAD